LEGLPLPAELWERTVLPARVPGYQPRWLDEAIARGAWAWCCQGEGDSGAGALAFFGRESLLQLPPPTLPNAPALDAASERVLECLQGRGALFVTDLAQLTGLAPGAVRAALWVLLRRRLVTNDQYDVVRHGEERDAPVQRSPARSRRAALRPEGRWALLPWGHPDPEAHALFLTTLLLERYGIVARELAQLDPWMLPWRTLYEVLSRMELAGADRGTAGQTADGPRERQP
jgi:ATP-dependent Lhr-like helicase